MKNRTVQKEALRDGQRVWVRGTIKGSRLASVIAGEELERDIKRKESFGIIPTTVPYTYATLDNPVVIPQDGESGALTPEEIYILESGYTAKDGSHRFTITNKSRFLPWFAQYDDTGHITQVRLEEEPEKGQDVTLVLHFRRSPKYNTPGIFLDGVIVNNA